MGDRNPTSRHPCHFTHVDNVESILETGEILSRNEAKRRDVMASDNADDAVIGGTRAEYLDLVRLYFRPRTPTQYRNEGILRANDVVNNAHCPVPIHFVFPFEHLMSMPGVRFSNGGLCRAESALGDDDDDFFKTIPFTVVYKTGSMQIKTTHECIGLRHAEVVFAKSLALDSAIASVLCRSSGERDTFLPLAGGAAHS